MNNCVVFGIPSNQALPEPVNQKMKKSPSPEEKGPKKIKIDKENLHPNLPPISTLENKEVELDRVPSKPLAVFCAVFDEDKNDTTEVDSQSSEVCQTETNSAELCQVFKIFARI